MIVKAIRDVLVNDATVTDDLATYDFGAGAKPAVFTTDPIPEDANLPAVVVTVIGGPRWGTRGKKGAEVSIDVRVWGNKFGASGANRSGKVMRRLAWNIWGALERAHLTITGYDEVGCLASAPQSLTDPEGFPGYVIPVMVRAIQQ